MPRFYFNIVTGTSVRKDLEGTELGGLEDAYREAVLDARAMMSNAILAGEDISSWRVNISDAEANTIGVVLFSDAIASKR